MADKLNLGAILAEDRGFAEDEVRQVVDLLKRLNAKYSRPSASEKRFNNIEDNIVPVDKCPVGHVAVSLTDLNSLDTLVNLTNNRPFEMPSNVVFVTEKRELCLPKGSTNVNVRNGETVEQALQRMNNRVRTAVEKSKDEGTNLEQVLNYVRGKVADGGVEESEEPDMAGGSILESFLASPEGGRLLQQLENGELSDDEEESDDEDMSGGNAQFASLEEQMQKRMANIKQMLDEEED